MSLYISSGIDTAFSKHIVSFRACSLNCEINILGKIRLPFVTHLSFSFLSCSFRSFSASFSTCFCNFSCSRFFFSSSLFSFFSSSSFNFNSFSCSFCSFRFFRSSFDKTILGLFIYQQIKKIFLN